LSPWLAGLNHQAGTIRQRKGTATTASKNESGGAAVAAAHAGLVGFLLEQFGQLVGHDAAQLLGIDDGDRAAVIAGHVVADAD
jgi:hypothetical protein